MLLCIYLHINMFLLILVYRVKALYVYQGIREDDLSFVEDEIIKAHPSKDKNSDWWYGTSLSTNAVGFFPRTYVEIIEKGIILKNKKRSVKKEEKN